MGDERHARRRRVLVGFVVVVVGVSNGDESRRDRVGVNDTVKAVETESLEQRCVRKLVAGALVERARRERQERAHKAPHETLAGCVQEEKVRRRREVEPRLGGGRRSRERPVLQHAPLPNAEYAVQDVKLMLIQIDGETHDAGAVAVLRVDVARRLEQIRDESDPAPFFVVGGERRAVHLRPHQRLARHDHVHDRLEVLRRRSFVGAEHARDFLGDLAIRVAESGRDLAREKLAPIVAGGKRRPRVRLRVGRPDVREVHGSAHRRVAPRHRARRDLRDPHRARASPSQIRGFLRRREGEKGARRSFSLDEAVRRMRLFLFAVALRVHHLRVHALLHGEPSEQGPVDEILVLLDAVPVPAARVHDHVGVPRRAGNLEAPPERPRAPRAAPRRAAHLGRKLVTPRG